jgi:hypothetical protein
MTSKNKRAMFFTLFPPFMHGKCYLYFTTFRYRGKELLARAALSYLSNSPTQRVGTERLWRSEWLATQTSGGISEGGAYITSRRETKGLEKIDILQIVPLSPRLRGTPFALRRCSILIYRGGKNGLPPEALR